LPIVDGIQAGRWLIQRGIRFHPKCSDGIELLRQYHYEYDEEKKTFSARPEHDFSSHAADAFRYLSCVVKHSEMLTKRDLPRKQEPVARPLHHSFTLDQLHADRTLSIGGRRRIA
jgi:phage terminase large subunit